LHLRASSTPAQSFRKWHVRINQNQRRYAVASALAATAIPALVMARGHRIDDVEEVPLVVTDAAESINKTSAAIQMLTDLGAAAELKKVVDSKKLRAGKGKMRSRRHVMRRGPLIVFKNGGKGSPIERAFRNIPGVELCSVERLNLLQLAPGGHLGRFCIWTESAFRALDEIFGTHETKSAVKSGFNLPYANMTNADLSRLINSDEVQATVRPVRAPVKRAALKKNPLKNFALMQKLNPAAATAKRRAFKKETAAIKAKADLIAAKRAGKHEVSAKEKAARKAIKESGKAWFKNAIAGTDTI
jgi:large subunit ribosomal protein L4e